MNCMEVKKQMDSLVERPNLSAELPGVQEHLQQCAVCREELQNATESIHLLAQMPRITPEAEFTAAWKSRIRSESAKQSSSKSFLAFLTMPALRPVLGTAMVVVIGLGVYTAFTQTHNPQLAKETPLGNQVQNRAMVALGQDAATGTYELQIMEVGLKGKEVQKLIRNFRNSHEGGVALMTREPEQDGSVVTGLSKQEAEQLRRKLEQAGAKVKVVAE